MGRRTLGAAEGLAVVSCFVLVIMGRRTLGAAEGLEAVVSCFVLVIMGRRTLGAAVVSCFVLVMGRRTLGAAVVSCFVLVMGCRTLGVAEGLETVVSCFVLVMTVVLGRSTFGAVEGTSCGFRGPSDRLVSEPFCRLTLSEV